MNQNLLTEKEHMFCFTRQMHKRVCVCVCVWMLFTPLSTKWIEFESRCVNIWVAHYLGFTISKGATLHVHYKGERKRKRNSKQTYGPIHALCGKQHIARKELHIRRAFNNLVKHLVWKPVLYSVFIWWKVRIKDHNRMCTRTWNAFHPHPNHGDITFNPPLGLTGSHQFPQPKAGCQS